MAKEKNKKLTDSSIQNTRFNTVKDKLFHIQKNFKEPELFEDLKQLFRKKGFSNVEITHGNKEYGKDLVCSFIDSAFGEERWFALIVKNKNATQNDFVNGGEIAQQVELASKKSYINSKGEHKIISGLFIIINGSVTINAKEIMRDFISPVVLANTQIWNYQKLEEEIEKNIKELFLDKVEPVVNVYTSTQLQKLSNVKGTNKLFDLDFEDINQFFVNVQTTYTKLKKKENEYVTYDKDAPKKFKEEELDDASEILNSKKNFIIYGIPTSGKSLLLRRIGIKALQQKTVKQNAVFFFELGKIFNLKDEKGFKFELRKLVEEQYRELTSGEVFEENKYNRVLILLDGLDEINSESKKKILLATIEKAISDNSVYSNMQVVLTSRTLDIIDKDDLLKDFEKTELLPMNIGQALNLIRKIIPNNNSKYNAFISALKNSLLTSNLMRTPLALTLMAILYRDNKIDLKELPANITELYNKFTDTYLDRWDVSKGIGQQYKYEQTKLLLSFIAFRLHEKGQSVITEMDLKDLLLEIRQEYNYDELNDVDKFMDHLKSRNGVFNYDEYSKSYSFYNHYFQEFFVSLSIEDKSESLLLSNFFNQWWENAVVFYCGKFPKRDTFIKSAIKNVIPIELRDKYIYLVQLSRCLQANHAISIKTRQNTVEKLLAEFDQFYLRFIEEGKEGKTLASSSTTMKIIIDFRDFFEKLFISKHVTSSEIQSYFEETLCNNKNGYSEVTLYSIAYFLAFNKGDKNALEIFAEKEDLDVIWSRIIYVDINFMKYKKSIDQKLFNRIRRKMTKNKFKIQENLRAISTTVLDGTESSDNPEGN